MNRREVLKAIALTAPLTVGGRLYAAPWTSTRLLVVFLRGAYDAANVVVPVSSDFYYQSRPTLAIARPNPNDPNAALPLDRDWGLHPALKETLYPLYQKNQLAFVRRTNPQHGRNRRLRQSTPVHRDCRQPLIMRAAGQYCVSSSLR